MGPNATPLIAVESHRAIHPSLNPGLHLKAAGEAKVPNFSAEAGNGAVVACKHHVASGQICKEKDGLRA